MLSYKIKTRITKSSEVRSSNELYKKETKKQQHKKQTRKKTRENSCSCTTALESHATKTINNYQEKKFRDTSEITNYKYNKKGHFISNYTEPRTKKRQ